MPDWLSMAEAAERMGVCPSTLQDMVRAAPLDLPGAPIAVGTGTKRTRRRWDAARLDEWLSAYRAWKAKRDAPAVPTYAPPRPPRTRRAGPAAPPEIDRFWPNGRKKSLLQIVKEMKEREREG